jgi:hypothetical protein
VTLRILKRPKEPILVVPTQADDIRTHLPLKPENRVDAAFGVGTSVNVVAEEYDGVVIGDLGMKLAKKTDSSNFKPAPFQSF